MEENRIMGMTLTQKILAHHYSAWGKNLKISIITHLWFNQYFLRTPVNKIFASTHYDSLPRFVLPFYPIGKHSIELSSETCH